MNETDRQAAIQTYLDELKTIYYRGNATEHSYRGVIETLLESLLPEIDAINEPKRVEVGAPDFVLIRRNPNPAQMELIRSVPLGFIEAKDLKPGILDKPENQSQIKRYMDLGNVVHTDGLTWRFYFDRELVKEMSFGYVNEQGNLVTATEHLDDFEFYLRQTIETAGRTIRTAKALALHMADRARPIRHTILQALEQDIDSGTNTELTNQYVAFKETLIHDLSTQDFADIYAETIAYGLFAARYNDDSPDDFNLIEAAQKVPQTNPFLRQFFLQIAAYEKDVRLDWVLNNFADLFSYADVHKIMSTYGQNTGMNHDPVTHFYETFLGEYDQKRRKARGVYYTPLPVVQYIVRAVDRVLKEEFGLPDGLADDSTVTKTFNVDPYQKGVSKGAKVYHTKEVEIPRVQILDPATGTSTFLNETVKLIAERKAERLGSGWNDYVEKNLLPRIHGFEILMAAYSMAHMRLGLTLAETGYKPSANAPRLGVYLTNALEEPAEDEPPLLAMMGMGRVLTEEAIAADKVKRDLPIMVVMGNPPYKSSSSNKGKYIQNLIGIYKKDLNEKKVNLDDDYVKFIRYAESMIEKTGQGVMAMITNNSYLDGATHRIMRQHLLTTFDNMTVVNLYGDIRNVASDDDKNVFDITQGVSIIIAIKKPGVQSSTANLFRYSEKMGPRKVKYEMLEQDSFEYSNILVQAPNYRLVPQPEASSEYDDYIKITELMPLYNSGIQTKRDKLTIHEDVNSLEKVIFDMINLDAEDIREKYQLPEDGRDWTIQGAKKDILGGYKTVSILYKPFDVKKTIYTGRSKGFLAYPRQITTSQFIERDNLGINFNRQHASENFSHILASEFPTAHGTFYLGNRGQDFLAPLWVYNPDGTRTANFDGTQLKSLLSGLESYCYVDSEEDLSGLQSDYVITAIDVLDYIYGVLHSPSYRAKYKEFLKIDFPRIPKPESIAEFERFAEAGKELRELHLMKNVTPGDYPLRGEGDGAVDKIRYEDGKVWINATQYFENVPEIAWNFYIGGYQPAQKWLKDRKGRTLGYKDIEHYQKIVKILLDTNKIMKEIM